MLCIGTLLCWHAYDVMFMGCDSHFGTQKNYATTTISSIRGITTQEGVKIQQRDQNSTAKEGHNSTKNPLNIDPGSVFNGGVKILSYTGKRNEPEKMFMR